ncbi:MAG: hypothetical protein WAQ08_12160 [Aquabacterium sp.]|uniref:hypothetical protein n=1 Tax=Aquabacterium sp. TaxID=1872578 RepID=UPI003BAFAE84
MLQTHHKNDNEVPQMKIVNIKELDQVLSTVHLDEAHDPLHDVEVSLANHKVVVVPCMLAVADRPQVPQEIALVIPRDLCRKGQPTRHGLMHAAAEAVRRHLAHRKHPWLEVRARVNGVLTPLMRVHTA